MFCLLKLNAMIKLIQFARSPASRGKRITPLQQCALRVLYRSNAYSTGVIGRPNHISRGCTDILRALEATIGIDNTAAHYKYYDDPFLIPSSNVAKRIYAMAQESGRKAANWVRNENSSLFRHREAIPKIKAFVPPTTIYADNIKEEDLNGLIENVRVLDAISAYKIIQQRRTFIESDTLQSLLELMCFCNSVDVMPAGFIEERWFRQNNDVKKIIKKTWNDGAFSEELFISMDKPSSLAYDALIQGMSKYYQAHRALGLFEEAVGKGHLLSATTYNGLISCAHLLRENNEMRWSFVQDMLTRMKQQQLAPTLGTMNSILEVLSAMGTSAITKELTLRTLREFKVLGIEPSLGSWYYVLTIYSKEKRSINTILYDIIPLIEDCEYKIQSSADVNFFVTAMEMCSKHLRDKDLAKRIINILLFRNNYDLIGDSYKESVFYRYFFTTLCTHEPFEEFMLNTYQRIVPHIYIPEPSVMHSILQSLHAEVGSGAHMYLPNLWTDIKSFDHTSREYIIDTVLLIMSETTQITNSASETLGQLGQTFADIAWDIWQFIEEQPEHRTQRLSFTGDMLGKIMVQLLYNNEFEKACFIMTKLDSGQNSISGVPSVEALKQFIYHCIKHGSPSMAINCLQYSRDCGFTETNSLAAKVNIGLTLDETHLRRLRKLYDHDPHTN